MMKPLTIEELKALPVDDWVWIEYDTYRVEGGYVQIQKSDDTMLFVKGSKYSYSDYGKTWVAYKNKEQAECKGEIVELPRKIGDTVYYIATHYGENGLEYDGVRETKFDYIAFADLGGFHFLTKAEAEKRLATLKGE